MKTIRKLSVIVLALLMVVSAGAVWTDTADAASVWDGSVDISWYDPDKAAATTEYHLSTPSELAGLAALVNGRTSYDCTGITYPAGYSDKDYDKFFKAETVNDFQLVGAGGGNTNDTVYVGSKDMDFDGVTFYLDADMDMGGKCNWTPIGGKFPLDTRSYKTIKKTDKFQYAKSPLKNTDCQTIESFFNGILDGQGHDITNLYCDRTTNKGFPYSMAIGLVGYLGGADNYEDESEMAQDWVPSVRNLTVSGDIQGRRMVAGIVGRFGDWPDGITVLNCGNRASVQSTDSRGRAGIVGSGGESSECKIVNCYNTGDISGTYSTSTGGIIGENDGVSIYNCYNAGTVKCSTDQNFAMGIGGHDSGSYTVENCYYLKGCAGTSAYPGYYKGTGTGLVLNTYEMTEAQMKGTNLIRCLNDDRTSGMPDITEPFVAGSGAFVADSGDINGGYPVLYFEKSGYSWGSKTCNVTVRGNSLGDVKGSVTGTVPYGTVVCLTDEPEGGNIRDTFTADGKAISADCYTATSDVTLSADFIQLQKGQAKFKDGSDYYISGKKSGTVDGTYEHTSNSQLLKTEGVFQLDKITAKASLTADAEPDDPDKEYTGGFNYIFTYANGKVYTSSQGKHTVTSDISKGGLTITAEPETRDKLWTSFADTGWYSASKKKFTIKTPEQLAGLAYLVNSKGITFKGCTVNLGKNITLANNDGTKGTRYWTAIGISSAKCFKGTFDGKGKVIKDMSAVSAGSYSALFGYIRGATVKNVTVRGTSKAISSAAGVAAFADSSAVTGCKSVVDVTSEGDNAGGILGQLKGKSSVKNCINYGAITGRSMIGGVCGQSVDKTSKLINTANEGEINASGSYAGGIVGKSNGDISGSGNTGNVTAADYAGGICGHTSGWDVPAVKNCYNKGAVQSKNDSADVHLGGLIGYAQYVSMNNCYNAGDVQATSHFGGICGMFYKSINNSIANAYYSDACEKALGDTEGEDKEKVKTEAMALSAMKNGAFAKKLNSVSKSTWVSVSGDTPELKWKKSAGKPADPGVVPEKHEETKEPSYDYARGGQTLTSGTYFIDPTATGVLNISGKVTLIGSKGEADGLKIRVENGAALTLNGVRLAGETNLIEIDNGTLILKGKNVLDENCTEGGNESPAVLIKKGTGTISGTGSLSCDTSIGNSPMLLEKGATFHLKSGTVSLVMTERLGKTGGVIDGSTEGDKTGAFTAKYGVVKVSGGVLKVTSKTNNVMAVAVAQYIQKGGKIYFYALEADQQKKRDSYGKAVNIDTVKLTGGELRVTSRIHDSKKKVYGIKAIQYRKLTGKKYIRN